METITLRYAGRRDTGKRISHLWLTDDDKQRWFDKFSATVVGGIYTVQGEIDDEGGMSITPSTLHWTGGKVDETTAAIWQANDQAALRAKGRRDAERRAGKATDLDRALEPLLELVRAARTRDDLHAIQMIVAERTTEAWYGR